MVDRGTEKFIKKTVREHCSPDQIHTTLAGFENQLEGATGDKRIVIEAFIEGIKRSLGRVS